MSFRPAGFSSDEDDSDDYGFYEKPVRNYNYSHHIEERNIENELENAICNGDKHLVESIIKNDLNLNPNYRLKSGWTPLMHACYHAQENIVEYLIDLGADPNVHSESVLPIMVACSNSAGDDEAVCNIIRTLLKKESILNVGDKFGQTPLMRAISSGRLSIVKLLLDQKVNIGSRDQQGWTALFWAVHNNQLEILKVLLENGASLSEVDRNSRTPYDIAVSHGYEDIINYLDEILDKNNDDIVYTNETLTQWHDFYPGINNNERLTYVSEIPHLLYGMNCERLAPLISNSKLDLRSFLNLDEKTMIKLGISMPYERQRLKYGLMNFHKRNWKVNCIAGLYARTNEKYGVIDCLASLGSHLQQIYIIEATLQYTVTQYEKIQNQLKFEPPDSSVLSNLQKASQKLLSDISDIRRELGIMKHLLNEISNENPSPIHLIKKGSSYETIITYIPSVLIFGSLAVLAYSAKNPLKVFFK